MKSIHGVPVTIAPRTKGKYYLIIQSGKYAERQGACVQRLGIDMLTFETPEGQEIDLMELEKFLSVHRSDIATVGMVHHETSTGMVNDVVAVTALVKRYCGKETSVIVDSISGFGACPLDIPASDVDVVITSPNKSIHGVPGFSIILAKRDLLARRVGNSRSFTLDLCSQLSGLDKNGQFLFTPPVHVLMCFEQALKEFINDGGIAGRQKRYKLHADTAIAGMKRLGFQLFLDPTKSSFGHIVVGFDFPTHKKWNFKTYYETLKDEAKVIIYPGKASTAETFRFGMIGAIDVSHIEKAVMGSESALRKMGIVPGVDDLYPVVPEHKKPGYFQHLLKKKKTMSKL
eukprot:Tbor_TRINITY_DN5869_c0_g3::TRINITY_DN5869_c0_g3_i1::g.6536::m.6536/K03430/phnW; 2-aminoethylphosphonate-pyruvate transaminase